MVKNYLFRSFSGSIWKMSFPTEYNAELAQNRREGGKFFKHINTANEEVKRREGWKIGMHKLCASKLVWPVLGCWKITQGPMHCRICRVLIHSFLSCFAQGLETSFTPSEWEKQFAQKHCSDSFQWRSFSGDQQPSLLYCGETTFCN